MNLRSHAQRTATPPSRGGAPALLWWSAPSCKGVASGRPRSAPPARCPVPCGDGGPDWWPVMRGRGLCKCVGAPAFSVRSHPLAMWWCASSYAPAPPSASGSPSPFSPTTFFSLFIPRPRNFACNPNIKLSSRWSWCWRTTLPLSTKGAFLEAEARQLSTPPRRLRLEGTSRSVDPSGAQRLLWERRSFVCDGIPGKTSPLGQTASSPGQCSLATDGFCVIHSPVSPQNNGVDALIDDVVVVHESVAPRPASPPLNHAEGPAGTEESSPRS